MPYAFNPLTGKFDYYQVGTGSPGPQGPAGQNGLTVPGADGEQGEDGFGIPGVKGDQGIQGVAGANGSMGYTIPGNDGEDGQDGFSIPGAPGANGANGSIGATGPIGPMMLSMDGDDGQDGHSIIGPQGPAGVTTVNNTTAFIYLDAESPDEPAVIPGPTGPQGPAGGGGGGLTLTDFTVNLGKSKTSGKFQITGLSGLTAGKNVLILQTAQPITSKGNAVDEIEMDYIELTGYVANTTTIQAYWSATGIVVGTYAFAYQVSA